MKYVVCFVTRLISYNAEGVFLSDLGRVLDSAEGLFTCPIKEKQIE